MAHGAIRVWLVTIINETTNCRYVHPYDLEDVGTEPHSDQGHEGVWFPMISEDINGIKWYC